MKIRAGHVLFLIIFLFLGWGKLTSSLLSAYGLEPKDQPKLDIETLSARCMGGRSTPLDIQVVDNTVIITKTIKTSTPCYEVKGSVKTVNNELLVELITVSTSEVCIMCVGEIVGRITVTNIPREVDSVRILTPEGEETVPIKIE